MPKISVIIPCYNVERYIRECLDSVIEQTLCEKEIICVDDGSTDDTLSVLEEYREKADVIILQQGNQGSGIARNQGIKAASGQYVAFMDADDFYPSIDALEKMYFAAQRENAEICGGSGCVFRNGIYNYTGFRKGFVFESDGWINKEDFPILNGYWRFIYNREFIKKNEIYFPEYLRCQDSPFFLNAIFHAGRVYCMQKVTYVYRKEHKQVSFTPRQAIDYAKGMRDSLTTAKRGKMASIQQQILNELHGELSAMMYLYGMKNEEMRHIIQQINEIIISIEPKNKEGFLLKEGDEISAYVDGAQKEIRCLLEKLKTEKLVLIYGAGTVGKGVRSFLNKNGISLEAFVVSDKNQNADSLDGLQIRCIDDYADRKDECMVIVATFPYLHEEIVKTLQEKKYNKVYILSLEKFHLYSGEVVH